MLTLKQWCQAEGGLCLTQCEWIYFRSKQRNLLKMLIDFNKFNTFHNMHICSISITTVSAASYGTMSNFSVTSMKRDTDMTRQWTKSNPPKTDEALTKNPSWKDIMVYVDCLAICGTIEENGSFLELFWAKLKKSKKSLKKLKKFFRRCRHL